MKNNFKTTPIEVLLKNLRYTNKNISDNYFFDEELEILKKEPNDILEADFINPKWDRISYKKNVNKFINVNYKEKKIILKLPSYLNIINIFHKSFFPLPFFTINGLILDSFKLEGEINGNTFFIPLSVFNSLNFKDILINVLFIDSYGVEIDLGLNFKLNETLSFKEKKAFIKDLQFCF